jgi:hypothetical protein
MNSPKQSPSTGESMKDQHQRRQEPARPHGGDARSDDSRAGARGGARPHDAPQQEAPPLPTSPSPDVTQSPPSQRGPKSGGMGPKQ